MNSFFSSSLMLCISILLLSCEKSDVFDRASVTDPEQYLEGSWVVVEDANNPEHWPDPWEDKVWMYAVFGKSTYEVYYIPDVHISCSFKDGVLYVPDGLSWDLMFDAVRQSLFPNYAGDYWDTPVSYNLSYHFPHPLGVTSVNLATEIRIIDGNSFYLKEGGKEYLYSRIKRFDRKTLNVESISLSPSMMTMMVGREVALTETIVPSVAQNKSVEWSSKNESVATVSKNGIVTAISAGRTIITVKTEDGNKTATCEVTVKEPIVAEAVDLGLSVKWATCNIGANSPYDKGYLFAWGETCPKSSFSWENYQWSRERDIYIWYYEYWSSDNYYLTKYNFDDYDGIVDNKTVLEVMDDAACANWGGNWRMPTKDEWRELMDKCSWEWDSKKHGYLVSRHGKGSIFLPADMHSIYHGAHSGFYWSSILSTNWVYSLEIWQYGKSINDTALPYYGYSVRPVMK